MYRSAGADPFLYENLHANLDELVDKLGKQYGGWYPFCSRCARPRPAGRPCPGSGCPSPPPTTWPTSRRRASEIPTPRPGPSCSPWARCSRSRATRWAFPSATAPTPTRPTGRSRGRTAPR
jgi:hypothetical protein